MANKKNVCVICGKKYDACATCSKYDLTSYKTVTDTKEHFDIFTALCKFNKGKISKDEAKKRLSACDLKDVASFVPRVAEKIKEIMKEVSTPKTATTVKANAPKKVNRYERPTKVEPKVEEVKEETATEE